MVTFSIKLSPGFIALFMHHTGLLCIVSIWLCSSVFPQAPTRGQDNTSVEISEGERREGGGSFPPLEVLDLYPAAATLTLHSCNSGHRCHLAHTHCSFPVVIA